MARIAGVNLPLNKRSEIGLTYIFGIGRSTANKLLAEVGVSPDTYVRGIEGLWLTGETTRARGIGIDKEARSGITAAEAVLGHYGWWPTRPPAAGDATPGHPTRKLTSAPRRRVARPRPGPAHR